MNICEAYRRFHEDDRRMAKWRRELRRISLDIESVIIWQDAALAEFLADDPAARRTIARFTGHTRYGWDCACGNDGRMKRLADLFGWERFSRAVCEARSALGYK